MEEIEHKFVEVNGLKFHIAEIGSGVSPVVVVLHGFPEIWYSWRHQMVVVAKAGYRAIAPDFRGYGLSGHPPQPEKTTFLDLTNDLLALLDALSISKAFLIGKDFGSAILSLFVLLHGERVQIWECHSCPHNQLITVKTSPKASIFHVGGSLGELNLILVGLTLKQ